MKDRIMTVSLFSAVSLVFVLSSGHAAEQGSCRALDHDACVAQPACRWVKGYQRSDGRSVAAYCRKLPAKRVVKEAPRSQAKRG